MKTLVNINDRNWITKMCMLLVLTFGLLTPQSLVYAQDPNAAPDQITATLCNAVNMLTGTVGRAIAILIVISLAIALFLGKVSWGLAIAVGVGMGILFGARSVVNILSNGTTCS